MLNLKDVVFEKENFWTHKTNEGYVIYENVGTHSQSHYVVDGTSKDRLNTAIGMIDYLIKKSISKRY